MEQGQLTHGKERIKEWNMRGEDGEESVCCVYEKDGDRKS